MPGIWDSKITTTVRIPTIKNVRGEMYISIYQSAEVIMFMK